MQPKVVPCPFCKRPLEIPLKHDGRIGCRQCHNVSRYDAATGSLSPLIRQNVKPGNAKTAAKKAMHWAIVALVTALATSLVLILLYFWLGPVERPASPLDELREQLDSLSV